MSKDALTLEAPNAAKSKANGRYMDDADRYRRQAKICLDEAQKATSVEDAEAWLKLAEEWMAMAEAAERQSSYEN